MNEVDVVIIGSGFGGSITANRLAQAGKRVLVLERGPWRDSLPVRSMGVQRTAPFPYGWKAFSHFLRSVQFARTGLNLNKSGMFELFSYPGVSVLATSGVGGGSMAYGGL
jgi:cholesterol oxidase